MQKPFGKYKKAEQLNWRFLVKNKDLKSFLLFIQKQAFTHANLKEKVSDTLSGF